jgi:hypothetical protein
MKRLLALAATGVIVTAVFGCGNKSDSALEKAAPPAGENAQAVQGNPNKAMPGPNSTQGGAGNNGFQGALGK